MAELAGRLLIAHPTLTRIVDGLVDGSLLYRRQSTQDRRRVAVHPSRRGHGRLTHLDALVAGYEGTLSAGARNEELIGLLRELSDRRSSDGRLLTFTSRGMVRLQGTG